MNQDLPNWQAQNPEETLLLLARLEPPTGLNDRVHSRLQIAQAKKAASSQSRASFWSLWMPVRRLQYAGAAVLMIAIGASTWGVYHHPAKQAKGSLLASPATSSSSFGAAKAEGHPKSLTPIKVPPVAKRKPTASRLKPAAKSSPAHPDVQPDAKAEKNP